MERYEDKRRSSNILLMLQEYQYRWASSNLPRAWREQKGRGRMNFALCLRQDMHLLSGDIGATALNSDRDLHLCPWILGFPGGSVVKNPPANAGDSRGGFDSWLGNIPWSRKWNPDQYSCLENSRDRGAWRATVHGVTRSQTRLSDWVHTHTHTHPLVLGHLDSSRNLHQWLPWFLGLWIWTETIPLALLTDSKSWRLSL